MTLQEFFENNKKLAIALSGGIDSVFLMYAAKKYGAAVRAYFVKTEFQPCFELCDARREAGACGVELSVIELSVLSDESIAENGAERCYLCKKRIMQSIAAAAKSDGYAVVCDGTNASDDADDRPGFRALSELGIISPLRLCGITKEEIRRLSREEGIAVWDKPSYACMATRVKTGERISEEKLLAIEASEDFLRERGFSDFRVRLHKDSAKLELRRDDFEKLLNERAVILDKLKAYFKSVTVDLEARDEKLCN